MAFVNSPGIFENGYAFFAVASLFLLELTTAF